MNPLLPTPPPQQNWFCGQWTGRNFSMCGSVCACENDNAPIVTEQGLVSSSLHCPLSSLQHEKNFLTPTLRHILYPFKSENQFNAVPFVCWATDYGMLFGVILSIVYLSSIVVGTRLMERRKQPFTLARPLIFWNSFLAIFSMFGFIRTFPHLVYYLMTRYGGITQGGYYLSVCMPAEAGYGHGAVGFSTMLFIASKPLELFDTLFLILRKHKVLFLHWYHHVTVMLFALHAYGTRNSGGIWFATINFGVHSIMYTYFALAASGVNRKYLRLVAPLITGLQIAQMIAGLFICASQWYYLYIAHPPGITIESGGGSSGSSATSTTTCDVDPSNLLFGTVIYVSYFYLFLVFALGKYCGRRDSANATTAAAGAAGAAGASRSITNTTSISDGSRTVKAMGVLEVVHGDGENRYHHHNDRAAITTTSITTTTAKMSTSGDPEEENDAKKTQ